MKTVVLRLPMWIELSWAQETLLSGLAGRVFPVGYIGTEVRIPRALPPIEVDSPPPGRRAHSRHAARATQREGTAHGDKCGLRSRIDSGAWFNLRYGIYDRRTALPPGRLCPPPAQTGTVRRSQLRVVGAQADERRRAPPWGRQPRAGPGRDPAVERDPNDRDVTTFDLIDARQTGKRSGPANRGTTRGTNRPKLARSS